MILWIVITISYIVLFICDLCIPYLRNRPYAIITTLLCGFVLDKLIILKNWGTLKSFGLLFILLVIANILMVICVIADIIIILRKKQVNVK